MKKAIIIIVSVLCTTSLSFAQSKKDVLLRFEEQSAAINSLNQQVGVLTAQRDQLNEQIKDLKKQVEELKALIAATNDSKLVNTGWTKKGDFCAGLASVQDDVTNKYGFINKSGEVVIPCRWNNAKDFNRRIENFAEVQDENGLWGFIDKSGKVVIPCKWYELFNYTNSPDMICVKDADGLYGFIDRTGKLIIPCKYLSTLGSDVPGRVTVKKVDDYWVDIDKTGREYR